MSKYKPYSAYKDSGIPWLGEIPAHWSVERLKFSVNLKNEKRNGTNEYSSYVGLENVESGTGRLIGGQSENSLDGVSNEFKSGDVLFGKLRPYLAKVVRAQSDGICSSEFLVLRPKDVISKYLAYELLNDRFIKIVDSSTYGAKMPRASWDFIGNIPSLIPLTAEQRQIAAFLDRETAKIDTLIAKQERLIELLQEKRQALISHAVTKGLDSTVPMKDSGVPWLGEVPDHWEVERLKSSVRLKNEKRNGSDDCSSYIGLENVESWTGKLIEGQSEISLDSISNKFKTGDVLFGKLRPYLAKVVKAQTDGICGSEFLVLRPKNVISQYLAYELLNDRFIKIVDSSTYGAKMPRASWDFIGNMPSLIPPEDEQRLVSSFLDSETTKIDTLVAKAKKAIALLKERRTAVISAVVTGKIDVRSDSISSPSHVNETS